MFFVLNLDLLYPRYESVYCAIIFAASFTHLEKSYPYLLIFAPNKDFLDVYNVGHPGQTQITKKLPNTESFL